MVVAGLEQCLHLVWMGLDFGEGGVGGEVALGNCSSLVVVGVPLGMWEARFVV